jgi:hypothetical protein
VRIRPGVLVCLAVTSLATLWAIGPRLGYRFPSMVDDWSAIANAPAQLHVVLRLGMPEELRYRPGFVVWNALQWHTLGAPASFVGPELWGLARVAVLVVGVLLLALLLVEARRPRILGRDARWLLVAGVPLAVLTPPALGVDLARYGPQEPLLVGCMALGAILLVHSVDTLLDRPGSWTTPVAAVAGVLVWSFGVLQKETSTCVLLLAPFLWPTVRAERGRWRLASPRQRVAVGLVAAGVLLPFVPMVVRAVQLGLADERVYESAATGTSLVSRLSAQLSQADEVLASNLPVFVALAAIAVVAVGAYRFGVDWLSLGLLAVAFAFVAFAADTGIVTSRYYLPPFVLTALALARSAVPLGTVAVVGAGVLLAVGGVYQAHSAHDWVASWVAGERTRESIVLAAAARAAGGCEVRAVGLNVELVAALPVLIPLAHEPPRGCTPGDRFVVVIDRGAPGTATPPDNPILAACRPEPTPVETIDVADIFRCTA